MGMRIGGKPLHMLIDRKQRGGKEGHHGPKVSTDLDVDDNVIATTTLK